MAKSAALKSALVILIATACGCLASPWRTGVDPTSQLAIAPAAELPVVRGPLVIHSDFPLPPNSPLLDEVIAEQGLIADRLGLPPGNAEIHVYLFAQEAAYRQTMAEQFPRFPHRRAMFVESHSQLKVFAHWSDRVAEDLRHEVAHGYLHAAVPNLPLWLDEGLAEYFEVGDAGRGFNAGYIAYLRGLQAAGNWRPDLARLERLKSAADMSQTDYAEAWLWVHFLLNHSGRSRELLAAYLTELRDSGLETPMSARVGDLTPDSDAELVRHLGKLAG
jgi:hypothetical protein